MPKLGDSKPCRICGGPAILRVVRPPVATLGWADGFSIPYDVTASLVWQCNNCGDRQPLAGELEGQ